jgi:hypothetical protein
MTATGCTRGRARAGSVFAWGNGCRPTTALRRGGKKWLAPCGAAAVGATRFLRRLPGSGARTHSSQGLGGGKLESDGRPQRCRARHVEGIGYPEQAHVRPFASVPVALGARSSRVGVPPTCNRHVTDTLPDELCLGVPLSPAPRPMTWAQRPQVQGAKRPIPRGTRCRECLSRLKKIWVAGPLAVGSWSYRLRHTLRLSRSGGRSLTEFISNPTGSQTPKRQLFSRPGGTRSDQVRPGQTRGSSWSSAATTARSSRSRS